jgi:hypothetical protein
MLVPTMSFLQPKKTSVQGIYLYRANCKPLNKCWKEKKKFAVDLDDEKITREHYIVGKINP